MGISYINNIPIEKYIIFLGDRRLFNRQKIIDYTNKIYNIDISNSIDKHKYWLTYPNTDVYAKYEFENPRTKQLEHTRTYFNSQGRRYFLKFIEMYSENAGYDALMLMSRASVVHHIYPLALGGRNDIDNLIQLSNLSHDLLHLNPKQGDESSCFRALDYLSYLLSFENIIDMFNKNNIEINNANSKLMYQLFKTLLTDEMETYFC